MSKAVCAFARQLEEARQEIAEYALHNSDDTNIADLRRMEQIRSSATDELAELEREVTDAEQEEQQDQLAHDNARQIWRIMGRYGELVSCLDQRPFSVEPVEASTKIADIVITTRPNVRIPAPLGALKAEIDATIIVIQSVMNDRMRALRASQNDARQQIQNLQDDYLRQAHGIALVGLETNEASRIKFAQDDLTRLKNLFVLREAGVVKNAYLVRLAQWSAIATGLSLAAYYLLRIRIVCDGHFIDQSLCESLYNLRNFALLAAGTAIGTWLSFALRRQELAFADLAVLEPDRLNPSARIWFMVGLAIVVGLLMFTGAIVAGVGSVTGADGMQRHGTWAALFGLLAGIAERALGNAVSRRGSDFAILAGGSQRQDATAKV